MENKKAKVILQIDCDSEIAMSNHYDLSMTNRDSCMNYYYALDKYIDLLHKYHLKATLFVVGADVNNNRKCEILEKAIHHQHEIANHTYHHPKVMGKESFESIRREIATTDDIIKKKLKVVPLGFRAPNFEADLRIIRILRAMGYRYDCSVLSTPYVPLIQLVKNKSARNTEYLGKWECMLAPQKPYYPSETAVWKSDKKILSDTLVELPISTFPYLHFPCHSSYLLALPERIRNKLLRYILSWYLNREQTLIYVFHLADLVNQNDLFGTEKKYYKNLEERLTFVEDFFRQISNTFQSETTIEYVNNMNYVTTMEHK